MRGLARGILLVMLAGFGVYLLLSLCLVGTAVTGFVALLDWAPGPLKPLLLMWAYGVPPGSDVVAGNLSVAESVPFRGIDVPPGFVCRIPVQGAYITDCFGVVRRGGYVHGGVDYGVPEGTSVHTPMNGVVVWAGPNGPWGNLVVVENQGWQVWLAHNSRIQVQVGQQVAAGQVVALSGNTGNSTGPHLHFEIRRKAGDGVEAVHPLHARLPGQVGLCDWYAVPISSKARGCNSR